MSQKEFPNISQRSFLHDLITRPSTISHEKNVDLIIYKKEDPEIDTMIKQLQSFNQTVWNKVITKLDSSIKIVLLTMISNQLYNSLNNQEINSRKKVKTNEEDEEVNVYTKIFTKGTEDKQQYDSVKSVANLIDVQHDLLHREKDLKKKSEIGKENFQSAYVKKENEKLSEAAIYDPAKVYNPAKVEVRSLKPISQKVEISGESHRDGNNINTTVGKYTVPALSTNKNQQKEISPIIKKTPKVYYANEEEIIRSKMNRKMLDNITNNFTPEYSQKTEPKFSYSNSQKRGQSEELYPTYQQSYELPKQEQYQLPPQQYQLPSQQYQLPPQQQYQLLQQQYQQSPRYIEPRSQPSKKYDFEGFIEVGKI